MKGWKECPLCKGTGIHSIQEKFNLTGSHVVCNKEPPKKIVSSKLKNVRKHF